jgi:predicted RNase H-like HicB family nuclease
VISNDRGKERGIKLPCFLFVLGGYIRYVRELAGANTQGETLEETRENLKDAVTLLIDCLNEESR